MNNSTRVPSWNCLHKVLLFISSRPIRLSTNSPLNYPRMGWQAQTNNHLEKFTFQEFFNQNTKKENILLITCLNFANLVQSCRHQFCSCKALHHIQVKCLISPKEDLYKRKQKNIVFFYFFLKTFPAKTFLLWFFFGTIKTKITSI